MFQLTEEEWGNFGKNAAQNVENEEDGDSSQTVMSSVMGPKNKNRGKAYRPYAFTEHGVTMLASVLKSEKAVNMSIAVVRVFIALKEHVMRQLSLKEKFVEINDRLDAHDVQLSSIYDAIENLLDDKAEEKKWEDRTRIGFKQG